MKKIIKLNIPRQLELLCSLMDTSTEELLQSFIEDACRTLKSNGHEEREMAEAYLEYYKKRHAKDNKLTVKTMLIGLDIIRYEHHQFAPDKEATYKRHVRKRLKEWYVYCQKIKTDQ